MVKPKKYSKKVIKKEPVQVPATPAIRSMRQVRRTAESYLKSIGTKPHMIQAYVDWAERRGYTKATNAEWKEIFSKF